MLRRREFLNTAAAATASAFLCRRSLDAQTAGGAADGLRFASGSIELELSPSEPRFVSLNIDGLAQGKRGANIIGKTAEATGYSATHAEGIRKTAHRRLLCAVGGSLRQSDTSWSEGFRPETSLT